MRKIILVAILGISACGGRIAAPVNVSNTFDGKLSCLHLAGEYENNDKRLIELTGESSAKPGANVGLILLNPIAGALFLDLSDTQKVEAQAITERNERISSLMNNRECADIPTMQNQHYPSG